MFLLLVTFRTVVDRTRSGLMTLDFSSNPGAAAAIRVLSILGGRRIGTSFFIVNGGVAPGDTGVVIHTRGRNRSVRGRDLARDPVSRLSTSSVQGRI